jgi:hypothetical protein
MNFSLFYLQKETFFLKKYKTINEPLIPDHYLYQKKDYYYFLV